MLCKSAWSSVNKYTELQAVPSCSALFLLVAAALLACIRAIKVELLNRQTGVVTIDRVEKNNLEVICVTDLDGEQSNFMMLTLQSKVPGVATEFQKVIRLAWNPANAMTPEEVIYRQYQNRTVQYTTYMQSGTNKAHNFTLGNLLLSDERSYRCEFENNVDSVTSETIFYYIRGIFDSLQLIDSLCSGVRRGEDSPPPEIGKIVVEIRCYLPEVYTFGTESEIQEIFSKNCEKGQFSI